MATSWGLFSVSSCSCDDLECCCRDVERACTRESCRAEGEEECCTKGKQEKTHNDAALPEKDDEKARCQNNSSSDAQAEASSCNDGSSCEPTKKPLEPVAFSDSRIDDDDDDICSCCRPGPKEEPPDTIQCGDSCCNDAPPQLGIELKVLGSGDDNDDNDGGDGCSCCAPRQIEAAEKLESERKKCGEACCATERLTPPAEEGSCTGDCCATAGTSRCGDAASQQVSDACGDNCCASGACAVEEKEQVSTCFPSGIFTWPLLTSGRTDSSASIRGRPHSRLPHRRFDVF